MVKKINGRTLYQWDLVRGYRELGNGAAWQEAGAYDLPQIAARGKAKAVWFLRNFHFSIKEPGVIQAVQNNLPAYKARGITPVLVAPAGDAQDGRGHLPGRIPENLGQPGPQVSFRRPGGDAILLCCEAPGEFCHRRLVTAWLEACLEVTVPEFREPSLFDDL